MNKTLFFAFLKKSGFKAVLGFMVIGLTGLVGFAPAATSSSPRPLSEIERDYQAAMDDERYWGAAALAANALGYHELEPLKSERERFRWAGRLAKAYNYAGAPGQANEFLKPYLKQIEMEPSSFSGEEDLSYVVITLLIVGAQGDYQLGKDRLGEKRLEEALLPERLQQISPDKRVELYLAAARIEYEAGQETNQAHARALLQKAIKVFSHAVPDTKEVGEISLLRGKIEQATGRISSAESYYKQAIRIFDALSEDPDAAEDVAEKSPSFFSADTPGNSGEETGNPLPPSPADLQRLKMANKATRARLWLALLYREKGDEKLMKEVLAAAGEKRRTAEAEPFIKVPISCNKGILASTRRQWVAVDLDLSDDGSLISFHVSSRDGPEILEERALSAIKAWRFVPRMINGGVVKAKGLRAQFECGAPVFGDKSGKESTLLFGRP